MAAVSILKQDMSTPRSGQSEDGVPALIACRQRMRAGSPPNQLIRQVYPAGAAWLQALSDV